MSVKCGRRHGRCMWHVGVNTAHTHTHTHSHYKVLLVQRPDLYICMTSSLLILLAVSFFISGHTGSSTNIVFSASNRSLLSDCFTSSLESTPSLFVNHIPIAQILTHLFLLLALSLRSTHHSHRPPLPHLFNPRLKAPFSAYPSCLCFLYMIDSTESVELTLRIVNVTSERALLFFGFHSFTFYFVISCIRLSWLLLHQSFLVLQSLSYAVVVD